MAHGCNKGVVSKCTSTTVRFGGRVRCYYMGVGGGLQ